MRHFFILILILSLSACHSASSKNYQISEKEKLVNKITSVTAQKIEAETGMRLTGVGGGSENNCYRKLNMAFDCYTEITLEQGRELLVYCVKEYLSAINANEEIRPHLIHFPFTAKDIHIEIFMYRPDHSEMPMGVLSIVSESEGVLRYKIRQQGDSSIKKVYEESYEDAIKILASEEPVNKIRKNYRSSCSA